MEWFQSNWIWIALAVGFLAMHMFGHGGHRQSHGGKSADGHFDPNSTNETMSAPRVEHTHANATVSEANDPAPRGASAHADHGASPTSREGKRHKHGC